METEHLDCQCSDFNHAIRLTLDPRDGEIWLDIRLNYCDPWYKRILTAIKYVFKRPVAYGHYDVTMLKEEDYDRIRDMLKRSEIAKGGAVGRAREQLLG